MTTTTTELRLGSAHPIETVPVRVLRALEGAGVNYCVLRGGDRLVETDSEDEIDLLVPPQQLHQLCAVVKGLGFVRLRTWGHAPHHFFVAYDEDADRWLKLDVVTQVAYGRPTHELSTELADGCLRNRQKVGAVYIPAPEDELVTLLLHCVVDKGSFPLHWQQRITALCTQIRDDSYVTELLSRYWSSALSCSGLKDAVQQNEWKLLLGERAAIERRLAARIPIRSHVTRWRDHLLRKLNHMALILRPHALSVAVLAPDGAGKSTLAAGVCSNFYFPVDQIYMGLYQKRSEGASVPGWGLLGKVFTQWKRYLQGYVKRIRGRFVIFDRYTYDALLPSRQKLTRLQRARRWLLAHCCPAPNLMLVLDAPGEILFARKGEHSVEYLEQHRQAYLRLRNDFPQLIVVDAVHDPDQVRRSVTSHIWRGFAGRLRGDH